MKSNILVVLFAVCTLALIFAGNASASNPDVRHEIKWGDTLSEIALKYFGKDWQSEIGRIAILNDIQDWDLIIAGRTIVIPSKNTALKKADVRKFKQSGKVARKKVKKIDSTPIAVDSVVAGTPATNPDVSVGVVVSPNIETSQAIKPPEVTVAERIKLVRAKRKADQEKKQREAAVGVAAPPPTQLVIEEVVKKAEQPSDEMAIPKISTPIGLVVIPPTVAGNDGQITGTNSLMEFKYATGEGYVPATAPSISGLSPGDYMVRYSAVPESGYEAGPDLMITVPAYAVSTVEKMSSPMNIEQIAGAQQKATPKMETTGITDALPIGIPTDQANKISESPEAVTVFIDDPNKKNKAEEINEITKKSMRKEEVAGEKLPDLPDRKIFFRYNRKPLDHERFIWKKNEIFILKLISGQCS